MSVGILVAVVLGVGLGRFVPLEFAETVGSLAPYGLLVILFLAGLDMGRQGNVIQSIREAGWRVLLFPLVTAIGTLAGGFVASFFLNLSVTQSLAVAAGFGWYSLAPMLLAEYSATLSAVAFLANVIRELASIFLIPLVARWVGYVECVSLPGAAAMDTVLPVVVGATHRDMTIYSFVTGLVLTLLVPVLVPFFGGM